MFHFAKIESNNEVSQVITINESDCNNLEFPESESVGQGFISSLGIQGEWKQTSTEGIFRHRYASIGSLYLSDIDLFTSARPFPSWILNADAEWEAPIPKPLEDGYWEWNETEQNWQR